tara:strand:- start:997 stop:1506 length:510 start_codon:yes stop_codon:yes gene_type:complete
MMNFSSKLKNFGLLEILVSCSLIYVVGMLIWTAASRPAIEAKAKKVTENHKLIVDLVNSEINRCDSDEDNQLTLWGDQCKGTWFADNILKYINDNLKIINPFSEGISVKTDPDPRLKAEGTAGQTVEMGVIFLMSKDFESEPGSEWLVGTCFKSPCVAAGNNELTSLYR